MNEFAYFVYLYIFIVYITCTCTLLVFSPVMPSPGPCIVETFALWKRSECYYSYPLGHPFCRHCTPKLDNTSSQATLTFSHSHLI